MSESACSFWLLYKGRRAVKPNIMVDNPAGKVALPALATTANTAKQPWKKRKTRVSRRSSKRESDDKKNTVQVRWREELRSKNKEKRASKTDSGNTGSNITSFFWLLFHTGNQGIVLFRRYKNGSSLREKLKIYFLTSTRTQLVNLLFVAYGIVGFGKFREKKISPQLPYLAVRKVCAKLGFQILFETQQPSSGWGTLTLHWTEVRGCVIGWCTEHGTLIGSGLLRHSPKAGER